jgi:hypothetical protein
LVTTIETGCACDGRVLEVTRNEGDGATTALTDSGPYASAESGSTPDAFSTTRGVESKSGTRIAVLGLRHADVETSFFDGPKFYDKERRMPCALALAADGTMRCLPDRALVAFTDPSCTEPIGIDYTIPCTSGEPVTFAVDSWEGANLCPTKGLTAYALGGAIAPPTQLYGQSIFGCLPRGPGDPGGNYREARRTSFDDWVLFTREATSVTDRLGVFSWDGTDGSRVVEGLALLPERILCTGATQGGSVARCVPSKRLRGQGGRLFGDNACGDELVTWCYPAPDLIEGDSLPEPPRAPGDPCASSSTPFDPVGQLYRVRDEVPRSEIRSKTADGGCGAAPGDSLLGSFHYFRSGAPVRFEDYPIVRREFSGSGRLRRALLVTSDGTPLYALPSILYDTAAGSTCTLYESRPGEPSYCVPDRARWSTFGDFFGDAGCTHILWEDTGCGSTRPIEVTSEVAGCPTKSFRGLTPYKGPVFKRGLTCEAVDPSAKQLYVLAETVDPRDYFPELVPTELSE